MKKSPMVKAVLAVKKSKANPAMKAVTPKGKATAGLCKDCSKKGKMV